MNKLLLALAAALTLGGCNLKYNSFPDAPLPFASVDYTVMGATSAKECGTYIFGIDWGHILTNQAGSASAGSADPLGAVLGMLPVGGASAETGRALYKAMDKMPEATNLYAPKVHETVKGFAPFGIPFFGKRCSEVEARGVKLGQGPVPNAH